MLIVLSSLAVLLFFALSCGVLRVILKDHNGDKPLGFVVFNPQWFSLYVMTVMQCICVFQSSDKFILSCETRGCVDGGVSPQVQVRFDLISLYCQISLKCVLHQKAFTFSQTDQTLQTYIWIRIGSTNSFIACCHTKFNVSIFSWGRKSENRG